MVVRSALANGMDWQNLDELVKAETANANPIASLIHELRLNRNKASDRRYAICFLQRFSTGSKPELPRAPEVYDL